MLFFPFNAPIFHFSNLTFWNKKILALPHDLLAVETSEKKMDRTHLIRTCKKTFYSPSTPTKRTAKNVTKSVTWSVAQLQGLRDAQEDRYITNFDLGKNRKLFMVCDGHRGSPCVDFVVDFFPEVLKSVCSSTTRQNMKQVLLRAVEKTHDAWANKVLGHSSKRKVKNKIEQEQVFQRVSKNFFELEWDSGTTLCCVVLDLTCRHVWFCNLGDSRAAVCYNETFILTTKDDKVPEVLRFLQGTEFAKTVKVEDARIQADLAMTGAIGDYTPDLLGVLLTEPTIFDFKIEKKATLVLATDGVFDILTEQDIFSNPIKDANAVLHEIHNKLEDNATLIVIEFGCP